MVFFSLHPARRIALAPWLSASFASLAAALLIYACFGTPTPDRPGWAEAAIGLLLLAAVGPGRAFAAISLPREGALWRKAGWLLLLYGLTAPVAGGLIAGRGLGLMIRDIVPFIFMLMPLFLAPLFTGRPDFRRQLFSLAVLLGVAFAIRVVWPYLGLFFGWFAGGKLPRLAPADPFYLANAPTVLFAALFLCGAAALMLYRSPGFSGHVKAGVCLALSFFPLAAMAFVSQRASLGYFCLCAVFLAGLGLMRAPVRALWPFVLACVIAALAWPDISALAASLWRKTLLVGINSRDSEAAAIIRIMQDSLPAIFFGKGWGMSFASPAVGGVTVNFTHSLITSFWLKTGLCGLTLALAYLGLLCSRLPHLLLRRPVVALALAGPLMIDTLLYASFKSLGFGLILLLIAVCRDEDGL
jgi:hypothetical protein